MRRRLLLWLGVLLFSAPVWARAGSSAEEQGRAAAVLLRAVAYADEGDCQRAVHGFEAAFQLGRDPAPLLAAARCYRQLGEDLDALRVLCWYQETARGPLADPSVSVQLDALAASTRRECASLPRADGTPAPPREVRERPPSLWRFAWPGSFLAAGGGLAVGGVAVARSLRRSSCEAPEDWETVERLALGSTLSVSAANLALYGVQERRVSPSLWMRPDGSLDANLTIDTPHRQLSFSLSLAETQTLVYFDLQRR